jgi:hypothetical protein
MTRRNRPEAQLQPSVLDRPPKRALTPTYRLTLRPLPGCDGERAIKALLKAALRRHGLRCIDIRECGP